MKLLGKTNRKEVIASIARHDYVAAGEGEDRICQDGGQPHTNHYAGYSRSWGKTVWFEVPQTFAELFNDYESNKVRKYRVWNIEDVRILPKDEWPDIDSIEVKAENYIWGTYGQSGKEKFQHTLLKDCSLDHLRAIIANVSHLHDETREVIEYLIKKYENQRIQ